RRVVDDEVWVATPDAVDGPDSSLRVDGDGALAHVAARPRDLGYVAGRRHPRELTLRALTGDDDVDVAVGPEVERLHLVGSRVLLEGGRFAGADRLENVAGLAVAAHGQHAVGERHEGQMDREGRDPGEVLELGALLLVDLAAAAHEEPRLRLEEARVGDGAVLLGRGEVGKGCGRPRA